MVASPSLSVVDEGVSVDSSTCLLHGHLPLSPGAPVLHKTVIQWWELGTKIENQQYASSRLPHVLLKISPPPAPTFCINTNQISPINLLHLISLSTSHPQLKLPYWQMHTHTNNFFFPLSILHCSNPTNDESSGGAVSVLFALKVVNGSKWEDGALLLPRFHVALLCERQPVVSNLGARVPISSFPAKPWHVSAQLHSSSWMFYPWLALMLSSSYCFKAASCNIKAAAQTKHIQAGSWGGKRDNLQQSDHAGFFFFCFNGSEGHAGDLLVQEIL